MSRILLIDEDESASTKLQKTFTAFGHEVVLAHDSKTAMTFIRKQVFDIVVCDVGGEHVDGLEISKYIRENSSLPLVLMTDMAEVLQSQVAGQDSESRLADAFVMKPIESESIIKAVAACLKMSSGRSTSPKSAGQKISVGQAEPELDDDYAKILISEFSQPKFANYPIFLQLSVKKFVKIAHRGIDLTNKRVEEIRGKGVEFLFLRGADFRHFLGTNFKGRSKPVVSDPVRNERRIDILRHTSEVFIDQLSKDGLDTALFESSMAYVQSTVNLLAESAEMNELLHMLSQHVDNLFSHGVGVSVYSVMIAKALGWENPTDLLNLTAAALLHDIGLRDIHPGILNTPRENWPQSVRAFYDTHATRGAEVLSQSNSMPEVVIRIVREHHESCDGEGFPNRMSRMQIHPMTKIVAVANEFCQRVLKTQGSPAMNPSQAVLDMEGTILKKIDSYFFNALKQIVR